MNKYIVFSMHTDLARSKAERLMCVDVDNEHLMSVTSCLKFSEAHVMSKEILDCASFAFSIHLTEHVKNCFVLNEKDYNEIYKDIYPAHGHITVLEDNHAEYESYKEHTDWLNT